MLLEVFPGISRNSLVGIRDFEDLLRFNSVGAPSAKLALALNETQELSYCEACSLGGYAEVEGIPVEFKLFNTIRH